MPNVSSTYDCLELAESFDSSFSGVEFEVQLDAIANAVVFECDDVFEWSLALTL